MFTFVEKVLEGQRELDRQKKEIEQMFAIMVGTLASFVPTIRAREEPSRSSRRELNDGCAFVFTTGPFKWSLVIRPDDQICILITKGIAADSMILLRFNERDKGGINFCNIAYIQTLREQLGAFVTAVYEWCPAARAYLAPYIDAAEATERRE